MKRIPHYRRLEGQAYGSTFSTRRIHANQVENFPVSHTDPSTSRNDLTDSRTILRILRIYFVYRFYVLVFITVAFYVMSCVL